jgi:hypothetical protein
VAKPSDDPHFFLLPPPPGRSRESVIRLDGRGRFLNDGEEVEHEGVARAMHTWIARHPIDGRFVLSNGYDWTYFAVDDVPYFVEAVGGSDDEPELALSDGSRERWAGGTLYVGEGDALYTWVKHRSAGGPYLAKLQPGAQLQLARWVDAIDGEPAVVLRGERLPMAARADTDALLPLAKS